MTIASFCPIHERFVRECGADCLSERVAYRQAREALRKYWRDRERRQLPLDMRYQHCPHCHKTLRQRVQRKPAA